MIGELPRSLTVAGAEHPIRTDFRDILTILVAYNDPELDNADKMFVCLYILYEDFEDLDPDCYREAYEEAIRFIDCGEEPKEGRHPRLMDWEQDERILFPAINTVAGFEVRAREYIHWWTFMGYFMEIREGVYAQVLSLRNKKAKGKKLEKWEREFWSSNRDMCSIKEKLTEEEQAEKDRLNAMFS